MRTGFFASLVASTVRWFELRKARQDMHRLDDRLLADIGLRRADINRAVIQGHITLRRTRGRALGMGGVAYR